MKQMIFQVSQLVKILQEARDADELHPTYDDLWNPALYPGNKVVDEEGVSFAEAGVFFDQFWPDGTRIQRNKLKPQLTLIGDYGIYIINNVASKQSPIDRGMIAYAKGCDPERNREAQANQYHIFGDESGSIALDISLIDNARKANKTELKLVIKGEKVIAV